MTSVRSLVLRTARRFLRGALSRVERWIGSGRELEAQRPKTYRDANTCRQFLLSVDPPDPNAASYLQFHLERLVRTLEIIPPPRSNASVLELGCYMQLTPALTKLCGYQTVAGAYLGPKGQSERKQATIGGEVVLTCDVDLFDAERDPFPYADGQFELVLACEIIEHLKCDPMHLLLETRRVLEAEGLLLLTTPNCASATAVARVLRGDRNPYTFSSYPRADAGESEQAPLHIREYTVAEIGELLDAAGFSIEVLFTERIAGFPETSWMEDIPQSSSFAH